MNVKEYGCSGQPVIMLLHGGGLSWWSCREAAALLAEDYHVVLPVLDGHAGSGDDFISIEANAERLIDYIDEHFGGSVLMIGGLSLGGQILAEMLSRRKDICSLAIIESALVIPMRMTCYLTAPMINISYGLIKKKWFSRLQFRSLGIRQELYEEYYRDTCEIKKENMIALLKANSAYKPKPALTDTEARVCILVGQKEQRIMLRSASVMHEMISESRLDIMRSLRHGEFSINHAPEYVCYIRRFIDNR